MGSFETLIKPIAHVVNNAKHLHILGNVKQPHKEYLVCFESTYKLLKKNKISHEAHAECLPINFFQMQHKRLGYKG